MLFSRCSDGGFFFFCRGGGLPPSLSRLWLSADSRWFVLAAGAEKSSDLRDNSIRAVIKHSLQSAAEIYKRIRTAAGAVGEQTLRADVEEVERSSTKSCGWWERCWERDNRHAPALICCFLFLFNSRYYINVPARSPVWSQYWVHLFVPAAFGHKGNTVASIKTPPLNSIYITILVRNPIRALPGFGSWW